MVHHSVALLKNDSAVCTTGHKLVFAHETGVCVQGNVVLRQDDVPDSWLAVSMLLVVLSAVIQ